MGVLTTYLEKLDVKELIYKVITPPVFLVAYTNKRSTCKALYALWFELCVDVFKR